MVPLLHLMISFGGKIKDNMRKFIHEDNPEKIVTEEELRQEFTKLQKENPSEYGHLKFGEYLKNCMWYNNGTLEEVSNE